MKHSSYKLCEVSEVESIHLLSLLKHT